MSSADYRSRLIAARERLRLSRAEMAQRLLTPRATYEQWEHGKRRTPGVAVVAAESFRRPKGVLMQKVRGLADGTLTAWQIAKQLRCERSEVYKALKILKQQGADVAVAPGRRGPKPGTARSGKRQTERNAQIAAAIAAGATLDAVSKQHGITCERARQIARSLGATSARSPAITHARRLAREAEAAAEKAARRAALDAKSAQMRKLVEAGLSISRAAGQVGITRGQINTIARRLNLGAITKHGRWRKQREMAS